MLHVARSWFAVAIAATLLTGSLVVQPSARAHAVAGADLRATPAHTWQPNDRVSAILRIGHVVYLGGRFTRLFNRAGSSVPRQHLAAIDVRTGNPLSWNPGTDGEVFALAASPAGDRLYVGGAFTRVHHSMRRGVAAFMPAGKLLPLKTRVRGGPVRALAVSSSTVFIGGGFNSVDGSRRVGLAAVSRGRGTLRSWYPGDASEGAVRAMLFAGASRLVIGGAFTSIGASSVPYLAAVDAGSGVQRRWDAHPAKPVDSLAAAGSSVYAGTRDNRANRYEASTGSLRFSLHGDGDVQAVAVQDGVLYIGGHFQLFDGRGAFHLAAADATTGAWVDWGAEVNSIHGVFSADGSKDALFIGGDFTQASGVHQAHFAMFTT